MVEHKFKFLRDYFEKGCLCIINGYIKIDTKEDDEEASTRYMGTCNCSRHPEHRYNKGE